LRKTIAISLCQKVHIDPVCKISLGLENNLKLNSNLAGRQRNKSPPAE